MTANLPDAYFSIGSPEAWDVVERDNLEHRFLPINEFDRISERGKMFLRGRRGAGKSAIALMLDRTTGCKYSAAIQGEVEEYGTYMDVVRAVCCKRDAGKDIDIEKSLKRLWIWVLPVKVMQIILSTTIAECDSTDDDIDAIWKYLDSFRLDPTTQSLHEESSIGHLLD